MWIAVGEVRVIVEVLGGWASVRGPGGRGRVVVGEAVGWRTRLVFVRIRVRVVVGEVLRERRVDAWLVGGEGTVVVGGVRESMGETVMEAASRGGMTKMQRVAVCERERLARGNIEDEIVGLE